jgi:NADH dehydrogenase
VAARRPWQAYRLPMLGDVGQIEVTQANVRAPDTIERALEGAEAAIYAVGVLYESGGQRFEALHAEGPKLAAEAAGRLGARHFVHISSIGADAGSASAYARTKAAGEAGVQGAFPAATILRPSVVFGPGDQFFNRFAAMATLSPALPLIGGGATRMQPVFVGDIAQAAAQALADPAAKARTFELGGPAVRSFRELMEVMLAEIGRRRALVPVPWPAAEAIGFGGDLVASLRATLPMLPAPPLTTDQVRQLKVDNVVAAGAAGLSDLGVTPTPLEAVLPTYLYPYRKGGQFAELTPPEGVGA